MKPFSDFKLGETLGAIDKALSAAWAHLPSLQDPKALAFTTPGVHWLFSENESRMYAGRLATIVDVQNDAAEAQILDNIEKHVRKYGKLDTIVISSHGNTNTLFPHRMDANGSFQTTDFLRKLEKLQEKLSKEKAGFKITDRIQFLGCNVLNFRRRNRRQHNIRIRRYIPGQSSSRI
jgi:hypothetical protein